MKAYQNQSAASGLGKELDWDLFRQGSTLTSQESGHDEARGTLIESLESQMAEFAGEHETLVAELRKQYVLPSGPGTALAEFNTACKILLDAATVLRDCFARDAILVLQVSNSESGPRTLYCSVVWPGSLADAKIALQKFDTWWIPRSRQASTSLAFTYELV